MKLIMKLVIPKISSCWESLGHSLQLKAPQLEVIRQSNSGDPKKCSVSMIEEWISSDEGVKPKTWPVLLQAIANTSELDTTTATSIKEELIKQ